jgi:hypothetical protein
MMASMTLGRDQDPGSLQCTDWSRSVGAVDPGVSLVRHAKRERGGDEEASGDELGRVSDVARFESGDRRQQQRDAQQAVVAVTFAKAMPGESARVEVMLAKQGDEDRPKQACAGRSRCHRTSGRGRK